MSKKKKKEYEDSGQFSNTIINDELVNLSLNPIKLEDYLDKVSISATNTYIENETIDRIIEKKLEKIKEDLLGQWGQWEISESLEEPNRNKTSDRDKEILKPFMEDPISRNYMESEDYSLLFDYFQSYLKYSLQYSDEEVSNNLCLLTRLLLEAEIDFIPRLRYIDRGMFFNVNLNSKQLSQLDILKRDPNIMMRGY